MTDDVAGSFGGRQRGLRGSEDEAVRLSADRLAGAGRIAFGQREQVGAGLVKFLTKAFQRLAKVGAFLRLASEEVESSRRQTKC